MVARKSSRVKKTTVVYQAPEQVSRSPRNAPHKTVTPRRSFNRDIELYMECVDDELSPAQLKAIKEAQKEHEKANDLIKEVRAGNTLVPSSQPNTFTIVPPKPSPAPPKPPPAPKVQASAFSSAPIQLDASSQRGLPPPRPAQFLSKQLQEIKKSTGAKISPEVILISDSTASSGTGKVTSVNVPLAHISGTPLPVQQMNSLLAPQGSGVTSQQVYKFVSLPSNMPANILTNQWTLKPVLAGVAQQQMTLVSPTSRAITNVAQIAAAKLSQDQMPAPRSTGEELNKAIGGYLLQGQGSPQGSTLIHNTYLSSPEGSNSKNNSHLLTDTCRHEKTIQFKKRRRKFCVISKAYSWKVGTHCLRISKLLGVCKAKQLYGNPQVSLDSMYLKFKCWFRKRRIKAKGKKSKKSSQSSRKIDGNDSEGSCALETCKNILTINCDKLSHSGQESGEFTHITKYRNNSNGESFNEDETPKTCDNFVKTGCIARHNSECGEELKIDNVCQDLYGKTGEFMNSCKSVVEKDVDCFSTARPLTRNLQFCQEDKFEFEFPCLKYLEEQTVPRIKISASKTKCNEDSKDVKKCSQYKDTKKLPTEPLTGDNSDFMTYKCQDNNCKDNFTGISDLNVEVVRTPLAELSNANHIGHNKALWEIHELKIRKNHDRNKNNSKFFNDTAEIRRSDKENLSELTEVKCTKSNKEKIKGKGKAKSFHRLYETLLENYIPRQFGIVNMVYESARFRTCDTDNLTMRTSDDCPTVSDGQLSDITNIACGNLRDTELVGVQGNNGNPNSNETRESNESDLQVQRCLNRLVDQVVMKDKKQTEGIRLENVEQCNKNKTKTKDCFDKVRKVDIPESTNSLSTCTPLPDWSTEKLPLSEDFDIRTSALGSDNNDEGLSLSSEQVQINSDDGCSKSNVVVCSDSDNELTQNDEIGNDSDIIKRKWYENITVTDELYILLLCNQFGFTKISKDLQVPKTELLKLRRSLRKSKHLHSKVSSLNVDITDPMKHNFHGDASWKLGKDLSSGEDSVLKKCYPCLYETARTLFKKRSEDIEELSKQECYETELDAASQVTVNDNVRTNVEHDGDADNVSTLCFEKPPFEDKGQSYLKEKVSTENKYRNSREQVHNNTVEKLLNTHNVVGNNSAEIDSDSESGDLVIDLDGFEGKVFEDENRMHRKDRTEFSGTDGKHCDVKVTSLIESDTQNDKDSKKESEHSCCSEKCSKREESIKCDGCAVLMHSDEEDSNGSQLENETLGIGCERKGKSDEADVLEYINDDHCYRKVLNETADTCNLNRTLSVEPEVIQIEDDDITDDSVHVPLNDCLTYPDGAFQLFDGKILSVFRAVSKAKLDEILRHLAKFGLKSTALRYKMPEEHIQILQYHTLSCTKSKKVNTILQLKDGIPNSYESSNHVNELTSKIFPEVISFDNTSSFVRHPVSSNEMPIRKDSAKRLKNYLRERSMREMNSIYHNIPIDLPQGHTLVVESYQKSVKFDCKGKPATNLDTRYKQSCEVSREQTKVCPKDTDNPVFTKHFLENFTQNRLYSALSKTPSKEKIMENQAAFELIDTQSTIKTYKCNGKDKHRYSPELQRQLLLLASSVGLKAVSEYFSISYETMKRWKENLRKALEKYTKSDIDKDRTKQKPVIEHKKRRMKLSRNLKIKICHLCYSEGIQEVCEQYNISRNVIRRWMNELKFETLQSYELTSKELVELVEYGEFKCSLSNIGTSNNNVSNKKLCTEESIDDGEQLLSLSQNKKGKIINREGKESSCVKVTKEIGGDQSFQVTYPNNMEVILDIGDNDSNSKEESIIEDVESDGEDNAIVVTETSLKTTMISNTNGNSNKKENVKDDILKDDFIDQNSSFMEAVSKELLSNDSENEDVVEIVSWDVRNEHDIDGICKEQSNLPKNDKANKEVGVFLENGNAIKLCKQQGFSLEETNTIGIVTAVKENTSKAFSDNKLLDKSSSLHRNDANKDKKFNTESSITGKNNDTPNVTVEKNHNKSSCEQVKQSTCSEVSNDQNKDPDNHASTLNCNVQFSYANKILNSCSEVMTEQSKDYDVDVLKSNLDGYDNGEIIAGKDRNSSCLQEPQLQITCPVDIKDEPFDEEFDRIEYGENAKKKVIDTKRAENTRKDYNHDRANTSGIDFKCDDFANRDTTDKGAKGTDFIESEINKLGTGDGDSSKSEGYTFQTNSGNSSTRSEGAGQSTAPGNAPNIDLNINSLSTENVQIVGTQDLIPGQEYILVDPRMFNSVSNSLQSLTPPTLIRPCLNTVNSGRPRVQVSGLVPSVLKAGEKPTPVHIVENRSLQIGTPASTPVGSISPLQGNMPRPSLTLFGQQNRSSVSPNVRKGSNTVRSLLTGMQASTRVVSSNVTHMNYVSDQSLKNSERKPSTSDCNSGIVVLPPNLSINPVKQSNVVHSQGPGNIQGHGNPTPFISSRHSNVPDQRQTSFSNAGKAENNMSYTLQGIGSISNTALGQEKATTLSTSLPNEPSTSAEIGKVPEFKEQDKPRLHEQFSKYIPNTDMLVEKERKLLQALLLQKTSKKELSTKSDSSSKIQESKPSEIPSHVQSGNRIGSLIQKMANRVQKGSDEVKLDLPVIGTDYPARNEVSKPASASEILFGEHASPKKKETEKDSVLKYHSVKSLLFDARPGNLTSSSKKDLRKSPLVVREIESAEDESSTSSGTSESTCSVETDSNIEEHEHAEGRIEHVDLSAKLKSLLSADIFNVIESEKGNNTEDDDLIEILAQPSDSSRDVDKDSKNKPVGPVKMTQKDENEFGTKAPLKKGGINYSLNIKKKLGKLASMFSTVSLHKKYGINPQTLSKWKAKYQDESIAGLELTEEELKELEEVNSIKKAMYGSNAQEYDIYVDNPEEDEVDSDTKKKKFGEENLNKDKLETRHVLKAEEKKGQGNQLVAIGNLEKSPLPARLSVGTHEKTNQGKVKVGTPLYITLDEDASDEMKQQLRKNLKTQKTVEHAWSNGAFLESSKSSFSSVFGTDKTEETQKIVPPVSKSKALSMPNDTLISTKKDNAVMTRETDQRRNTLSRMLDEKTAESDNVIWEKTVYLCPDEGIFKYRYEKRITGESPKSSNENQTFSVLDNLFRSSDRCETSTDVQEAVDKNSTMQENVSISSPLISDMLKATAKQKLNTSPELLKKNIDKSVFDTVDHADEKYSDNFKWTVVKEARKSGFEKTAKWYNISMTDIMKWHDTFLHEKKSKPLNTQVQANTLSESDSTVVDLTKDVNMELNKTEPILIPTPVKGRLGTLNANLSFERIQVKEGAITKPRFNSRSDSHIAAPQIPAVSVSPSSRTQRTRMGPNTIKYATPKVDPDQLQKFQADVQGDLGIMPKLMKKSNSRDGVEIASTWKQVQSVLKPEKPVEKRYTQEFKQKIIAECERKGQKIVSQENRIPYNEISRWRLEAKKNTLLPTHQKSAFTKTDSTRKVDSSLSAASTITTSSKKNLSEQSTSQSSTKEPPSSTEQESLKIKIRLSTLPQATPTVSKKKTSEQSTLLQTKDVPKTIAAHGSKRSSPGKTDVTSKACDNNMEQRKKKQPSSNSKISNVDRLEPVTLDEDVDLRMEVINFCFDHGVLKTQKKYNVTRQSIIDLMKEYDELSKLEVDNYNKSHGFHTFKTKLVSREKTSVEVTNRATQPVIVKNLNDYIVTQEYMKTVVDYALKHGITAASRKYKRKTSTVRSWMNQFQREVKKKISVEQVAKEQELIANNVSIEEARKISSQEARKKKQLLEAEFRRHIVEFARQFGITAASRRFKKKAATVKSWMGHFMKSERDAKRQEVTEIRKKQGDDIDSVSSLKQIQSSSSPRRFSHVQDSTVQKSPSSSRQRTPPHSPISLWDQDFVIKPTSGKSPLKLTFSPRRKSSPVIVIGSSTEEDTVDDETNDIETDDEQEHAPGEYYEVAAWNLDNCGNKSESKGTNSSKTKESVLVKEAVDNVVDLLSDEDYTEKKRGNDHSSKILSPNDGERIPEKTLQADTSKTSSSSDDSQAVDVTDLFDVENANIVSEIDRLLESKSVKENEKDAGHFSEVKDSEEPVIIDDDGNKANTEEEVKMPYEETVMFKLLTDELDNFMKNDAVAVKYNVQKETDVSKSEEKSPPAKETSVDKPMKKFKKYADAEIMQNIEETYLFTGARVTRNAVGKELKMCDEIMEEKDEREIETEEKIDDNDSKLEVLSTDTTQTKEIEDNLHLDCKVSASENVNHEKSSELPVSDTLPVSDNQKKGERSLFDFLSVKPDTPKEDTKEVVVSNSVASFEKKDELKSPFSLFGNIMKSFQMEQSIGVKSPSKNECKPDNSVANSTDLSKDSEGIEKAEELVKDRTERNLFDFICPEPEMSKTPTKLPSPEVQTSPRMQTRSLFKSGKAVSLSPQKLSPVKITPLKKPMFKFPKLALPVNFGNIAKLGMAKMKEEEKAKEGNENKTKDDEQNEISVKESAAKESDQVKFETKKESSGEAKDEIVMETFEELRQRLSKERAANKLEKERAKEISDTDAMEVDEIDGSRETSANTEPKTSVEIDSEMYENFTPQKIVLILDISKKHGVEFASTSFGLPVSVIVNWIIEKDRKQRKVALSVSLEEKLKSLKNIKDREITREAVKEKYNVDDAAIHKWDSEISWMIEDKNVCDILEKWKTVETVSNINFEECSKNLERRDSVVEKELVDDQAKLSEQSDEKDNEVKKSKEVKSTIANDEENHDVEKSEIKIAALPAKSVEGDSKGSDACLPQENIQDKKSDTDPSLIIEDERVEKKPLEIVDDPTGESEINPISEHEDIIITKVENPELVKVTESSASENAQDATSANNDDERDIPEIISFVRTTKPRDFTIEQKAMIVLLTEKYGNSLVNRKFGINTGTMYNWRHGNKHVRQYLYEQGHSSVKKTDVSSDKSEVSVKDRFPNETRSFTASDYLPSRETRSSSDKKITEVLNDVERTEGMKKQTASEPQLPPKSKLQGKEAGKEKDLINHPKGYRIISPTKLPSILKDIDIKSVQAKDYTLEQRVAIVKLVHLYGVRTIHKQFHISTTSIWSWQNCKIINEMLNEEEGEKNESLGAQREINFDVDEEGPMTIDTVLDRVLIATDTLSHLNFDTNQRADIVCLIDHFGIDYFCEKVPQIPRGTLWNWRHNKQVVALAKNREEMIKRYSDRLNTYEANKIRENVVGETVDKTDLTQKWLKDVQDNIHGKRRGDSEERSKRKMEESEMRRKSYSRKKPKLGPMCYKRSLSNDRIKRSLSPSTVCSETSVHSEDFEEIFSDDELNTPSVVSKKSGTSSQTAQSSKTSRSQPRTSKGNASGKTEIGQVSQSNGLVNEKLDTTGEPVHEIVKFECGQDERMMVCYKDLEPAEASSKHVKADNPSPTLKRPSPVEASTLQPPVKKKTQGTKAAEPNELGGNWVPLDEYYYGTHEGDTSYTEEKGEYRFKCWYCSKMLYNNVRAMQHIQGHIDASKQQNIDLSDLTQCKHCYKQFDTPFEMQTHVEKVHLSNKVLMCRICEKDFSTPVQLTVHMKSNHHACEMPYVCHLCNFRSSMYSDVVDHFKKKHDSSHYMLCLYCLRTFEVKFVNQGWGQTQTYYGHLLKHQTKSATKKCVVCRLTFFNTQDVKNHRKNCHMGHFKDVKVYSPGGKADTGQKPRKGSNLKSLNAPSVSRIQDYGDIIFPAEASNTKCVECKMMMSTTDHYKKYVHCTMCRFATSCSVAYANHMMGFHSGQMSSLNLNIPWERPMKEVMFCACGFSSKYGNKIANHLVYCGKWTSYSTRRSQSEISSGASGENKKEGSILGMLGLVQKSSVCIKIRSKPKLDNKPKEIQTKKSEDVDEDVNKKSLTKEKIEVKPITEDLKVRKMSEEKDTTDTTDVETKQHVVTDTSKKPDEEIDRPKDICENKKSPTDIDEEVKDTEKDNLTKEADIINLDSEDENSENHKSEEAESKSIKLVNDAAAESEETKKQVETVTEETSCVAPAENKGDKTNEEEVMEQDTANELDVKTGVEEDVISDKEKKELALKETDEKSNTDGKEEDEKETMDITTDVTEDRSAEELVDKEEMESMEEEDKQNEPDTSIESPKVEESLEKENAKLDTETCVEKSPEVKEMDVDAESMDTQEKVADNEEDVEEVKETTDDPKEHVTEGNTVHEEENKQSGEQVVVEQSPVENTSSKVNEENKPKEADIPKEGNETKEEEKDKEVYVEREKSEDRASSSDRRVSSDRSSQDRHRDSSERHSIERRDSRDRHHSGSSERSKYDDRSRRDDRHRQDNRSHGSNRSDSYHSNRSSYDQNRDRSYDRDRDYNRNRDYRHGDSRSGHGYQDNRGYGGQGHRGHQGQYGGYQGNRGGNNQDRSYNRNYQNRGGYNQNYRGNQRGGYY